MTTSGDTAAFAICFWVVLAAVVAGSATLVDAGAELRRFRPATVVLWLAVAAPSFVGVLLPAFYDALYRDPDRVRSGQVWRLVTGSVVQDGGASGAVLNLAVLWVVGSLAVAVWGPRWAPALFLVGALAFNVTAAYALDAPGGGNSAATLFLGTSVLGLLAVHRRGRTALVAAVVVAVAAVVLIAALDAHGLAVAAGLVMGGAVAASDRAGWARGARAGGDAGPG